MKMSKTRNWAFVVYPESVPDGWEELLANTHIPAFVSPLHDSDADENGELKKPHYHVILMMDGPITHKRANEIIAPFGGTQSAEYIKSLRGYVRYLAHLDNPEKAQYDPAEIVTINGANLADVLRFSQSDADKYQVIGEIMRYCEENGVHEFSALVKFAVNEREAWLPVIVNKPYFVNRFLDSMRYSSHK